MSVIYVNVTRRSQSRQPEIRTAETLKVTKLHIGNHSPLQLLTLSLATGAQMKSSQGAGDDPGRSWLGGTGGKDSNHQEEMGETMGGNQKECLVTGWKLVTAIKLQPQNLEQNFWPKKKGKKTQNLLCSCVCLIEGILNISLTPSTLFRGQSHPVYE